MSPLNYSDYNFVILIVFVENCSDILRRDNNVERLHNTIAWGSICVIFES